MQPITHITILGAGAWGSALALTAARAGSTARQTAEQTAGQHGAGRTVSLWGRNRDTLRALEQSEGWLPSIRLTDQLEDAVRSAEVIVFALPAQSVRDCVQAFFAGTLLPALPCIFACKGIESTTGLLISEVLDDLGLSLASAFLGGPHLAHEVRAGLPTAGTLGLGLQAQMQNLGPTLRQVFHHPGFSVELSSDAVGVQLVGAFKNILALLSGLIMGAELGENARAALLTAGVREMMRLGRALGAEEATFLTQAGLGDILATCLSPRSRNTNFGVRFARGESPDPQAPLAEGFFTTGAVRERARSLGLQLPLLETLAQILDNPGEIPEEIGFSMRSSVRLSLLSSLTHLMKEFSDV